MSISDLRVLSENEPNREAVYSVDTRMATTADLVDALIELGGVVRLYGAGGIPQSAQEPGYYLVFRLPRKNDASD